MGTSVLIIQASRHIALGMIHPIGRARKEIQKLGWDVTIRDEKDGIPIDRYDYYVIQKTSIGNTSMVDALLERGNVIIYDDAACFVADTEITLVDNSKVKIADLVGEEEFKVLSYNKGEFKIGIATNCRLVYKDVPVMGVIFESGEEYKCTYDQKFMLSTNQYKEATELVVGDTVISMIGDPTDPSSLTYDTKRVLVADAAGTADVYDFSVKKYHNFVLDSGVVVHNSTGTHAMKYLTKKGCVGYVKKQLLKDRSLYKTTYPRHRWHYYNLSKMNPKLDSATEPADWATDKILNKVQMGWNLGLMTRNGLVVDHTPEYDSKRDIDIHCIIKTKSNPKTRNLINMSVREPDKNMKMTPEYWYSHYTWHRVMCQDKLSSICKKHKFTAQLTRAPKILYLEKLRRSKVCVSPLGLGEICFTGDTKISLLDGTEVPIKDLTNRKEFYVYSYDFNTNSIVPGRAHSCKLTREKAPIVKVTLDNGEEIKCTPDHLFLTRGRKYVEAKDLRSGDSLMPLYRRVNEKGYEELHQPTGDWEQTHRVVYNWKYGHDLYNSRMWVAHHNTYDKKNNDPGSLNAMSWTQHQLFHASHNKEFTERYWNTDEYAESRELLLKKMSENTTKRNLENWQDPEYREYMHDKLLEVRKVAWDNPITVERIRRKMRESWTPEKRQWFSENNPSNPEAVSKAQKKLAVEGRHVSQTNKNPFIGGKFSGRIALEGRIFKVIKKVLSMGLEVCEETYERFRPRTTPKWNTLLRYFDSYQEATKLANHKVVSVESAGYEDVYDFTVDEYHNFALSSGVFVHNCFRDFEAITSGALLVKPNMDHLETWPNIYIPGVTYVDVKWDWSDLEEKLKHILGNWESYKKMRMDAFEALKVGWNNKTFAIRFSKVMNRVIENI